MTTRPPQGFPLPDLVLVANRVLKQEAEALRAALDEFSNAPRPGCPWEQDDRAVSGHAGPEAQGRARLLALTRHQAMLIYINAYDHLLTLGRVLGGDGAMPVFSYASLSRVVCEAAVRCAWLMDPGISSEERIVRGAVALWVSADERLKGARRLPAQRFDGRVLRQMLDSCTAERDAIEDLITGAGLTFGYSQNGRAKARLELVPGVSVSLKINVSDLMAELLPESPSWYNIGSSVAHSHFWGLREVENSNPGGPRAITPNVLTVGAAAESAISAAGLILDRCARCYGHDPSALLWRTRQRREAIDFLMRRAVTSSWVLIPTEPQRRVSGGG